MILDIKIPTKIKLNSLVAWKEYNIFIDDNSLKTNITTLLIMLK